MKIFGGSHHHLTTSLRRPKPKSNSLFLLPMPRLMVTDGQPQGVVSRELYQKITLEHLQNLPSSVHQSLYTLRFPLQCVVSVSLDRFRAFIYQGILHKEGNDDDDGMMMMWGESRLGLGRGGGVRPTSCPRAAPPLGLKTQMHRPPAMQAQNGEEVCKKTQSMVFYPQKK